MKKYKELKIWQKGIELVKEVYALTHNFPNEEKFGLTSQIRRSAISIPSNIAEGYGRNSDKELNHFLNITRGSSYELDTQIIIAYEINYISENSLNLVSDRIDEIQRMITNFQKQLK